MAKGNVRADAARQADENYLKTILLLQIKKGHAFVSELAEELEMNITTTYSAVNRLAEQGYIQPLERRGGRKSNKQSLVFTAEGEALAKKIMERHQTIHGWLIRLGIPEAEADEEACHMEHGLTENTMSIIRRHVEMAAQFEAHGASAPEVMRKLARHMKEDGEPGGMTISEKLHGTVERLGGMEGIERKGALVTRAGGEERLEAVLNLMDSVGGFETVSGEREEYLALQEFAAQHGGTEAIRKKLELLDELGGPETAKRLKSAAEALGGTEHLLKIVNGEYKLWSAVFERTQAGKDEAE